MNRIFDEIKSDLVGMQSLLQAIGDAMFYGPKDASQYANGIWLLVELLDKSKEKLKIEPPKGGE